MICNPLMADTRAVMATALREKIKELALDPMQLQRHFNAFFVQTDKVHMKMNRVSREIHFDQSGFHFGASDSQQTALGFGSIDRGPRDEICPIWYSHVEKFLAAQNGTQNNNCCFKIIYQGAVKTICIDEDVYGESCQ